MVESNPVNRPFHVASLCLAELDHAEHTVIRALRHALHRVADVLQLRGRHMDGRQGDPAYFREAGLI